MSNRFTRLYQRTIEKYKKYNMSSITFKLINVISKFSKMSLYYIYLEIQEHINIDLNRYLKSYGIGNYGDLIETGEDFLYGKILKNNIISKNPIVFDVGANPGSKLQYKNLKQYIHKQTITYAFEPNKTAYKKLISLSPNNKFQINENIALGDKCGNIKHYSYEKYKNTELATDNKKVLVERIKIKSKIIEYEVKVDTIDNYCKKKRIKKIDFLKIDVEGAEYDVIKGASKMLKENKIEFIQFEFNIHNIYKKVFIKDFYELLEGYHFYRLAKNKLIPLLEYKTDYEIFMYQNIFASRRKVLR